MIIVHELSLATDILLATLVLEEESIIWIIFLTYKYGTKDRMFNEKDCNRPVKKAYRHKDKMGKNKGYKLFYV